MSEEYHESREALGKPDVAQGSLTEIGHFIDAETDLSLVGAGRRSGSFQPQTRDRRGLDDATCQFAESSGGTWKQHARHQRD